MSEPPKHQGHVHALYVADRCLGSDEMSAPAAASGTEAVWRMISLCPQKDKYMSCVQYDIGMDVCRKTHT